METEDINKVRAQYGARVVYDAASPTFIRGEANTQTGDFFDNLEDFWGHGQNENPRDYDPDSEYRVRFHPARDVGWHYPKVGPQCERLLESGLVQSFDSLYIGGQYNPSGLFTGPTGFDDFAQCIDLLGGRNRQAFYDIAPDIFIPLELIHQTGEIVEEVYVDLTARQFLPFANYNTWMTQYRYDRIQEHGHGFSLPFNMGSSAGIPTPKQSVRRKPIYNPLYHHYSGASWNEFELEQINEARGNGAPDLQLVRRYTAMAQGDIRRTENALAYFGFPAEGIEGILYDDEIVTVAAPVQFGNPANTLEQERRVIVDAVCAVRDESISKERVDRILVGTALYCYLNTTIYKNLSSDSTRTLMSVIMEAVGPLGVREIVEAPEMEFRQLQATRLEDEHGFTNALAERWSGGRVPDGGGTPENCILYMNSSREK